jgi:hypothetical protein
LQVITCSGKEGDTNLGFIMAQPNPFSNSTNISFGVPQSSPTQVLLYDITGKQIAELFNGFAQTNETYQINLNANNLAAGVYLVKMISANNEVKTYKLDLMR